MIHRLKNQTLGKINSCRSYLSSIVFRRDSHSQVRSKPDHDRRRREYERNVEGKEKKEHDGLFLCKSKGQHLLTNTRILDAIVRRSDVRPTDTVLEIGPGTGNLTMKLLEAAQNVVAVELDKRMVEILRKRVSDNGFANKLTIIEKDVLKTDFPQFDLVVANIPYNISSPLVAKLVYGSNTFRSATLLLQKEFSRRLLANPGDSDFNRLAVNVKLVADVKFVMDVSKREFVPPPKVDSSVVIITPKDVKPDVNVQEWLAFTRTCFGKKNKTLGSMFRQKKKVMELLSLSVRRNGSKVGVMNHKTGGNFDSDVEEDEHEDHFLCLDTDASMLKEKVIGILRSNGFEEKRPSKLSHGDLLHLLFLFNQAGIFFHDTITSLPMDLHE
ncbi:Ribosomal RNA small subunit methyltransferase [Cardamine amara subsp. amara]|uniref:rRNA adenine N(6)-methyltransferase n=1 Tax=Cardamine amara subsp. amara TaxID=228776 RepID=A0ABD1BEK2_CARAN